MRKIDLSGRVYGYLYVISQSASKRANGQKVYRCVCRCRSIAFVRSYNLTSGVTKSCGCLQKETVASTKPSTTHGRSKSIEYKLLDGAKQRAKKKGLAFDLTLDDISIPETCPYLDTPMVSPSVDRIDNDKGYTKDNIMIVSRRGNVLKNDATLEELQALVRNLEHYKRK